jgi:hypothetical protein
MQTGSVAGMMMMIMMQWLIPMVLHLMMVVLRIIWAAARAYVAEVRL